MRGWCFNVIGFATGAAPEVTPTLLKTDAGIVVNCDTIADDVGVSEPVFDEALPLVTLTTTSAATTTRTTPTAIQVKRPAGRPADVCCDGEVATMLLCRSLTLQT